MIEVLFRVKTLANPRHIVLDGGPDLLRQRGMGVGKIWHIVKHRTLLVFDAAIAKLLCPFVRRNHRHQYDQVNTNGLKLQYAVVLVV